MGYGTGVYYVTFVQYWMRGAITGVIGASSLDIAQQTGIPQNYLVALRGVGLILGPVAFGSVMGRALWSGESMAFFSAWALARSICAFIVPRTSSHSVLYGCFVLIGLSMAVLDTFGLIVVTRVRGADARVPLIVLSIAYGLGGMMAPFLVVAGGGRAWDVLALVDFLMAASMLRKRVFKGKPKNWKEKGCRTSPPDSLEGTPVAAKSVPPRVFRAGLALIFLVKAAETAMSSWGFTFAVLGLRLPRASAALLPSVFYMGSSAMRFLLVPLSLRVAPSTIVQASSVVIFVSCTCFLGLSLRAERLLAASAFGYGVAAGPAAAVSLPPLLASVALVGLGCSPLFAQTITSMQRHGDLDARQQGVYVTCANLGNTLGLWLPGIISLPKAEFLGAVATVLLLSSHSREFPWRQKSVLGR